jgi:hypothetical protein
LGPYVHAIFALESSLATPSDAYLAWNQLLRYADSLPAEAAGGALKSSTEKRRKRFVECRAISAAFVLDPRNHDKIASDEKAVRWTKELFGRILDSKEEVIRCHVEFEDYFAGRGVFRDALDVLLSAAPIAFWSGTLTMFAAELARVGMYVFSIPPSSASAERVFSQLGRTITKTRANLSDKKAVMAVQVAAYHARSASKAAARRREREESEALRTLEVIRAGKLLSADGASECEEAAATSTEEIEDDDAAASLVHVCVNADAAGDGCATAFLDALERPSEEGDGEPAEGEEDEWAK